jgi:hypothetical protein
MNGMAIVYAKQSATVTWGDGDSAFLKKDQPWDSDSALVRARPELFTEVPEKVHGRPLNVERATRAPGETRNVTVPKVARKAPASGE